ncbi:MAG: hypothetical protein LBL09_03790 [Oscillospiraceae bacterium]|nr:hypothetical protein [Oscillospiraceae bacterium]
MKKILLTAAVFLFGAVVGCGLTFLAYIYELDIPLLPSSYPNADETAQTHILDDSVEVLSLLKERNFKELAKYIHPEKGVIFTPYSTVLPDSDQVFTADLIKGFQDDTNLYIWGTADGSGDPISMTPTQYFDRYVFDRNYVNAPVVGINTVMRQGNSLENVIEAFPGAEFVEFHYPGSDENSQFDWSSLKIVFENYNGSRKIIALIHSEWTI